MRVVVMISGGGSNLQAIIDAIALGQLEAEIVLVVSNRKNAYGIERAQNARIQTIYSPLKPYIDTGKSRENYDHDLAETVQLYQPDLIVLAGWMHVLSPAFLDRFPRQVINLHPALPHIFNGTNAIERAFEAYELGEITHSGCMVHYAIPDVDMGDVIIQATVPILDDDTLETFAARMHAKEHEIIVQAIRLFQRRMNNKKANPNGSPE